MATIRPVEKRDREEWLRMRNAQAAILTEALALERRAVAEIEAALECITVGAADKNGTSIR